MRLHDLRLIEDPRSVVRFPGNLTVVAGLSPAARAFLAKAVPSLLAGEECGLLAYADLDGAAREVGPGALAQRFLLDDATEVVLGPAPFDAVLDALAEASPRPSTLRVTDEHLERARRGYDAAMQSLDVLERSLELTRAEHRGAIVAGEDLASAIVEAQAAIDPIAATVRDRVLENASRLEVEVGAPPGVCRGESADAAAARLVRLEAVLFELDSALHALVPVDTGSVEDALDLVRLLRADGPVEVPEALRLAEEYRSLRAQIAALEERVAADEGGMTLVNDRLDHARTRVATAEARLQPVEANDDDIAELERAHDAVLEAEKRVSGFFGGRSRKVLDEALGAERAILERLGFPTWSAFIMGAGMLDSAAEAKREHELARRELDEAERVWSRVMAKLASDAEFSAYMDRLERLQEAAHAIVGDVDDVEGALRALRVDPGPATIDEAQARTVLADALVDLGFGIEAHATLDDLEDAARAWLTEVRDIVALHAQVDVDAKHCAAELDEARETAERLAIVGAPEAIEGFGADRLQQAREEIVRSEERLWRHREAVLRVSQLVAEAERVAELELALASEVTSRTELLGITKELADASAAKFALLEAAHAVRTDDDTDTDTDATAAEPNAGEDVPDRVDALTVVLEERINALRVAGVDGAIPLVLDDAFAGLAATERAELLGWLEGYSLFLQVIYLAGGPEVVAWAEGRHSNRTRVVRGDGFFG